MCVLRWLRWLRGRLVWLWLRFGCWRRGHSPGPFTLTYRGRGRCRVCCACGKLLPADPPVCGRPGPSIVRRSERGA